MPLTITLAPDDESRLSERAAEAGQDLPTYLSRVLARFASAATSLEELSGPIHQNFLATGMTDDELGGLLEDAKHRMRADRRGSSHHG